MGIQKQNVATKINAKAFQDDGWVSEEFSFDSINLVLSLFCLFMFKVQVNVIFKQLSLVARVQICLEQVSWKNILQTLEIIKSKFYSVTFFQFTANCSKLSWKQCQILIKKSVPIKFKASVVKMKNIWKNLKSKFIMPCYFFIHLEYQILNSTGFIFEVVLS